MFCCVAAILVAGLAASGVQAAPGATCGQMVGDLQAYLDTHPQVTGTRKQTKDAQLMHQPTERSVAKAKMQSRDNLVALLAKAKSQQNEGDDVGCRSTLADVERMLKP